MSNHKKYPYGELEIKKNNKEQQHEESKTEVRTPKIDIYEENHQYYLRLSIPGVKKENLQILFSNQDHLEIKGTVNSYEPEHTKKVITEEIYQGPFYRRVRIPKNTDKQNLNFDYNRGILEIFIPKFSSKDDE